MPRKSENHGEKMKSSMANWSKFGTDNEYVLNHEDGLAVIGFSGLANGRRVVRPFKAIFSGGYIRVSKVELRHFEHLDSNIF